MRFVSTIILLVAVLQSAGMASIECSSRSFDFGVMDVGTVVSHTFVIKNSSASEVKFHLEAVSCAACLSVPTIPASLDAGESGEVTLRLNTAGKAGAVDQQAVLTTTDPETPKILLRVSCVAKSIWCDPPQINLGHVSGAKSQTVDVKVYEAGLEGKVSIEASASSDIGQTRCYSADKSMPDSNGIRVVGVVRCLIQTGGRVGPLDFTLNVNAKSSQGASTMRVPVIIYGVGAFEMEPSQVFFGTVEPGREYKEQVRFDAGVNSSLLRSLHSDASMLKLNVSSPALELSGKTVSLILRVPSDEQIRPLKGVISGQTDDGSRISIPWYAIVGESHRLPTRGDATTQPSAQR